MSGIIDYRLRPPLRSYLKTAIRDTKGFTRYSALQGVSPAASAEAFSMPLLLAEMDRAGITIGVMNGRQCSDFRGEVTNADLAVICNDYPNKLHALSGANPFRGKSNVAEAQLYIRQYGFKGISFDPGGYEEAMFADDERLFAYYEVCM